MYIKKADREFFEELDNNLKIPNYFKGFISKIEKKHRLIIKSSKGYHCDNCNKDFDTKKKYKADELCKCPHCKLDLIVKSIQIKRFEQADQLAILYHYKDFWIERCFETKTWYNNKKYYSHTCEYARLIYNQSFKLEYEIINDNMFSGIGCVSICHKSFESSNWRYFSSPWKAVGSYFQYIPSNIKKVMKNTDYKYSKLWDYVKHVDYIDLIDILKYYNNSVELLIKLGFYKLVEEHHLFEEGKNFKERFGIEKEYYSFIKRHNLDSKQLLALSYCSKKDIKLVNDIAKLRDDDIEYFKKYKIDISYVRKHIEEGHVYHDYLNMCNTLDYNMKNKRYLYPEDINTAHDKVVKQYKTKKDRAISNKIRKRYSELKKKEFEYGDFVIIAAKCTEDLINESAQQGHCVQDYAERLADGVCDIFFMRLKENVKKSLVTIEVRNNKIVQARIFDNDPPTKEQKKVLDLWQKRVLEEIK